MKSWIKQRVERICIWGACLGALLIAPMALAAQQASEQELLPEYQPVDNLSGTLSSVGSDTFSTLMTYWGDQFKHYYPNVNVQIQATGSSTAPTALIEGTAQLGPMSRKMKDRELQAFERTHGYQPTALRVAIDALAVFVHEDNPLEGINFAQLDAIFSQTLRCGGTTPITHWGQLGLDGRWQQRDIQLFGRNSVSGTYGFFKQQALCSGDFRNNVNEQPGSASVVQSVSSSLNALGYSGIGYRTSGIRLLPIAKQGEEYIDASVENVTNGSYPLSRYLYIYVNKHPNKAMDPLVEEFVSFILSRGGQALVEKGGYVPLAPYIVNKDRRQLF